MHRGASVESSCTMTQGYTPPEAKESEYQTIPMSKIEDFGVHANQYYALEVCPPHLQPWHAAPMVWDPLTYAQSCDALGSTQRGLSLQSRRS